MSEQYPKVYLYKRVVQAKLFIDEHYTHPIDLNNIADEAYFSKFHFLRLFKQIYGKTPHQYLISVKIKHALLMLQNGDNVTNTCYTVGFESIGSFCSLFKKRVGVTPSQYLIQEQELKRAKQQKPLHFIPGCHVKSLR